MKLLNNETLREEIEKCTWVEDYKVYIAVADDIEQIEFVQIISDFLCENYYISYSMSLEQNTYETKFEFFNGSIICVFKRLPGFGYTTCDTVLYSKNIENNIFTMYHLSACERFPIPYTSDALEPMEETNNELLNDFLSSFKVTSPNNKNLR